LIYNFAYLIKIHLKLFTSILILIQKLHFLSKHFNKFGKSKRWNLMGSNAHVKPPSCLYRFWNRQVYINKFCCGPALTARSQNQDKLMYILKWKEDYLKLKLTIPCILLTFLKRVWRGEVWWWFLPCPRSKQTYIVQILI
jgi:hypothetical protein